MKVELSWDQVREIEKLLKALRATQDYGSKGTILSGEDSQLTWDNQKVTFEIPD